MTKYANALTAALALSLSASGCAGGGSTPLPQTATTASSPSLTRTVVTLHIDRPVATSTASKRPAYVSAATQSLVYSITDPGGNAVSGGAGYVNLTPGSSYCSSSGALQPLTCTVSLPIAIAQSGTYTFDVATYDAQQSASCTPSGTPACSGTLLSRADLGETLTVGAANSVSLTLAGVPTSIELLPTSLMTLTVGSTFSLVGSGAHAFLVQALDADGNAIVGTGAPSFTIGMSGFGGTLTQPTSTSPNVFTVTPPSTYTSTQGTITATASYAASATDGCAQPGAVCTASATIGMRELLAIAQIGGGVGLFADGDSQPIVSYSLATRILTFDANGNMFALTNSKAFEYAAPLGSSPTITSVSRLTTQPPGNFFSDGHGHLIEANANTSTLYRYSIPLGSVSTFAAVGSQATLDGSGNVILAAGSLDVVAQDGTVQTITNGFNAAYLVAIRSDGTIAVADNGNNTISLFAPPYTGGASASLSFSDYVDDMAFDASGNLYIIDGTTHSLEELSSSLSGVTATVALPSIASQLVVVAGSHLLVNAVSWIYEYQLPLSSSSRPILSYPNAGTSVKIAAYP